MSMTENKPKSHSTAKPHPLAGQAMSGAEMVIQVLADLGVDTIFGYSGGAILPTYDAIFKHNAKKQDKVGSDISLVVPANEQGAGFMAAGYARATGKPGICLVTSGPGATNTVTPVRDCMADSIPIIVLCGQVPRHAMGTDAFQEAPVLNIMSACAKHTFLITDPAKLEETIRAAWEVALSGRPGPVVIDLPKDIQTWAGKYKGEGVLKFRGYELRLAETRHSRISEQSANQFFRMLKESRRPLLYVGGGVIHSDASAELRAFAEGYGIPVVTTLHGIGSFPVDSPLSMHMLGMHGTPYANYAVEDCDFIIALGSRFDDRVAGKIKAFAPNAKYFAHIDVDAAEIGKVKMVDWSHVGDAKQALKDLMHFGKGVKTDYAEWQAHVVQLKKNHALGYDKNSETIQPYRVIELLSKITNGDAIISTGVGQHQMWAAQYFEYKHPRTWLTSGSMGTMGFGLPAAIGAQLACPGKTVIDIDGDGSIRMNLGELETCTTYNIPVKVLLLNNMGDGMVRQWQKTYYDFRFSGSDKSLHLKDFVKAAEADGFQFAKRVSDNGSLEQVLRDFIAFDGPAFLEVYIDREAGVFPMVGPGMGYKEMIVGDWINPRGAAKVAEKNGAVTPELF